MKPYFERGDWTRSALALTEITPENAVEVAKAKLEDTAHPIDSLGWRPIVAALVARVEALEVLVSNEMGARLELQQQRDAAVAILREAGQLYDIGRVGVGRDIDKALSALGVDDAKETP